MLMKKTCSSLLSIIFLCSFLAPLYAEGNKSVLIAPTRVILEGRTTASNVRLINPNDTARKYRISLVAVRMDENGVRTIVDAPDEKESHAISLFRFSPRQVTIPPGDSQVVRIKVLKSKDLPDGEYRAHLKVEPVPDKRDNTESGDNNSQENIGVKINIVYQVSIPIFYRKGISETEAVPGQPVLMPPDGQKDPFVEFRLERKGLFSIFADIFLYHFPKEGGKKEKIGETLGVAGYTPVTSQIVRIPVSMENAARLSGGQIQIEVIDREANDRKIIGTKTYSIN